VHGPNLEAMKSAVMGACLLQEGTCPDTSRVDSQQLSFRLPQQVEEMLEGNIAQCEYQKNFMCKNVLLRCEMHG